ncbi:hypothetical protein GCM10011492_05600 [Flexivirga endophytica]|uniref:DNA-binding protein n=1 Tax=Flexivirga endophytica TaxID=1849103 RepID=A0A916WPP6_9MICO|nr:hypothetical protein [Flexivirga endophytica]GGB18627.1 hypothetical protein GCM10011492_05600 [Flexivirga endophytica]GHB37048.1 hypothetical protein GCM10008112_02010 [Flexivirga endophytica]
MPDRVGRVDSQLRQAKLTVMAMVGVSEAAERLGVSSRRVQQLIACRELQAPVRGLGGTQLSHWVAACGTLTRTIERTRGRALVAHYVAHPSTAGRLSQEVVSGDHSALLGLSAMTRVDGYVAASELQRLVRRHGLIRDDSGAVTLRATATDLEVVRDLFEHSAVLTALDLASSLDTREQGAGLNMLTRALRDFHC